MKNTVSFETAKRIFETGFPQPETVQEGQFWYSCIVRKTRERELRYINQFDRTGILPTEFFACYPYFAPTATDILAALFPAEIQFQISAMQVLQMALDPESAALAWLEIHEKKAFTPNARIKFVREQVVECYDAEGNQTVLHIDSSMGKEYEAIVTDETVTIESVFGLITLPRKEAFILEWL